MRCRCIAAAELIADQSQVVLKGRAGYLIAMMAMDLRSAASRTF